MSSPSSNVVNTNSPVMSQVTPTLNPSIQISPRQAQMHPHPQLLQPSQSNYHHQGGPYHSQQISHPHAYQYYTGGGGGGLLSLHHHPKPGRATDSIESQQSKEFLTLESASKNKLPADESASSPYQKQQPVVGESKCICFLISRNRSMSNIKYYHINTS